MTDKIYDQIFTKTGRMECQQGSPLQLICLFRFRNVVKHRSPWVIMSRSAKHTEPRPKRSLGLAGMSHLQGNAVSHSLPEVLSKVHLGLREHLVYDCFWDPALPTARGHQQNGQRKEISVLLWRWEHATHTFRSMLSNQVNWVLFGSSEQGFMTIQVGPFSALERTKWNPYCPS